MKIICMVLLTMSGVGLVDGVLYPFALGQTPKEGPSISRNVANGRATDERSTAAPNANKDHERDQQFSAIRMYQSGSTRQQALGRGRNKTKPVSSAQNFPLGRRMMPEQSEATRQPHQPRSTKVRASARANAGQATRSLLAFPPDTQPRGGASHRGVNPPVIGAISRAYRSNGAIDGAEVHRRP